MHDLPAAAAAAAVALLCLCCRCGCVDDAEHGSLLQSLDTVVCPLGAWCVYHSLSPEELASSHWCKGMSVCWRWVLYAVQDSV